MKTLLVLGATGVMGQRIVRLARRLLPDVRCVGGSRRAITDVNAIINAVGPFDYDPTTLVTSCFEAGCHYVDIAETPEFIVAVEQTAKELADKHDAAQRPPSVLSGCSTVPGLIQVFAQHWAGHEDVHHLRILLSLGSANPISPTLLFSLLRPLGQKTPDGATYFGELIRKSFPDTATRLYGRYPSPFEVNGIRIDDRWLSTQFYAGMDRAIYTYALWLVAKFLPRLSAPQLMRLCRFAIPLITIARWFGTTEGILSTEAHGDANQIVDEIQVRAQQEGLNVPALPSVWAARKLLEEDKLLPSGPISLDQLFTPQQVMEWLQQEGYVVSSHERRSAP